MKMKIKKRHGAGICSKFFFAIHVKSSIIPSKITKVYLFISRVF